MPLRHSAAKLLKIIFLSSNNCGEATKHNRLGPEPIRFVRLDSEHAQSDGKSVNRGLPVLDMARGQGQRSRFLVLTKRSAASGDENGVSPDWLRQRSACYMTGKTILDGFSS